MDFTLTTVTKSTTTDDAAPSGAAEQFTIPARYDPANGLPTEALSLFVEFLDGGGAEVAGASCSLQLWIQAGAVSPTKWIRAGAKIQNVGNRRLITVAIPRLNAHAKAYVQITDITGSPTTTKVYPAACGAHGLPIDAATQALRVGDVLVRGGEQNALGVHRTILAAIASADGAVAWDDSAAKEASSVTKAAPGCLYGGWVHNDNAAGRFLQFYNATSVPADTAVPKLSLWIPANSTLQFVVPGERRYFDTGICWALSTTLATKTIAAADAFGSIAFA